MQEPLMTSLYKLECHDPCEEGWDALLKHLGIHPSEVGCLETPFKVRTPSLSVTLSAF